ncbi:M28 family peptidase [Bradyrhizobium hipponense]|uniref:M28 family peptidase n=1 Tax=Bradyrhizobium hipponense TaxID=2605638 RepID=A0A5S4YM60_9BRAD|nr:M28 family peptidase [Bradyrhizobium hipponense]TYO65450.1 M28 family peptidase [Bradyrhizobium hipponense]
MSDLETIIAMLSYRRPARSATEKAFIEKFIVPTGAKRDKHGNWCLTIGEVPTVLWSSHTDSVHRSEGYQRVDFDGKFITLTVNSKSSCLGADCAAGVWIMIEMIKAKVPGMYIFHDAEEIGCQGSRAIAENEPGRLISIEAAIAFDRKGIDSIITHQRQRCCSDAFAKSMQPMLPSRYRLDDTGFVTDTKQYMHLVQECTNLSVGYYNEHHPHEALDVGHLIELRDHMVKFDQSKLVIERDPFAPVKPKIKKPTGSGLGLRRLRRREETLRDLVYWYPEKVSAFLENKGFTFDQLHDAIHEHDDDTGDAFGSLFDDLLSGAA